MEPEEITLRDQLMARVRCRLHAQDDGTAASLIGIMRDVDVYATMKAREVYVEVALLQGACAGVPARRDHLKRRAANRFPLPKRTRQVLREEPVPGTEWPRFRVMDGGFLQVQAAPLADWYSFGGHLTTNWKAMRHALDLHDNPCRTEEVEADESNPWGDE